MADEADIANDYAEQQLKHSLQNLQANTTPRPIPDGCCHWCADELDGGRLFCGPECAQRYEHNMRMRG